MTDEKELQSCYKMSFPALQGEEGPIFCGDFHGKYIHLFWLTKH